MTVTTAIDGQPLDQAYKQITDRIGEAAARAGRKPSDVVMVAVNQNRHARPHPRTGRDGPHRSG